MKVVGTVTDCVQVGIDVWANRSYSKVFTMDSTLQDIENWAKRIFPRVVNPFDRIALSVVLEEDELTDK